MNTNRTYAGKPFTVLVGLGPSHKTVKIGQIKTGNVIKNGLLATSFAGILPEQGSFTVADNDFSTGRVEILLGNYSLVSNIDYQVGALAANTAANVAASISRLPGFSATNVGADVTVEYDSASANIVSFKINHYGTVANFATVVPDGGELELGSPEPSGVIIS